MQPLSVKQLGLGAGVYLAVAGSGTWLLAAAGVPELAPAALIAEALAALLLVLHLRVPPERRRPYLGPGLALAIAAVATPAYFAVEAPWTMTPAFLAPELPIPELASSLGARLDTKVRLSGRVRWWDDYPYGSGLAQPVKARIENETGAIDVILDRAALPRELEAGQELRLVGRIRRWEGGVVRVVALSVVAVDEGT